MGRGKSRRKRAVIDVIEPTPEQFGKGQFHRNTLAYRRIPVIDTMAQTGKLSARQHYGLARYRDTAIAEERSPMRDSLDKALHVRAGATDGIGHIRAKLELRRLERALGPLRHIAHAIAVNDTTVSQLAIDQWGGREKTSNGSTFIVPRGEHYAKAIIKAVKDAGDLLAEAIGA